jgi:hypothetical protein
MRTCEWQRKIGALLSKNQLRASKTGNYFVPAFYIHVSIPHLRCPALVHRPRQAFDKAVFRGSEKITFEFQGGKSNGVRGQAVNGTVTARRIGERDY